MYAEQMSSGQLLSAQHTSMLETLVAVCETVPDLTERCVEIDRELSSQLCFIFVPVYVDALLPLSIIVSTVLLRRRHLADILADSVARLLSSESQQVVSSPQQLLAGAEQAAQLGTSGE